MLATVAVIGLILAARPSFDDARSVSKAQRIISSMTATVDETHDEGRMARLLQAQSFNAKLAGQHYVPGNDGLRGSNGGTDDILSLYAGDMVDEVAPYESQLLWNGYPAMCWLEIPCIGVREPVYHGTSDDALAQGVGHVDWSSLPVGGIPSHCVMAAHSGMREARMFDDLDKLEPGDAFVIHTLGDAYQYVVFMTEVVTPEEARERCAIRPGKDECTLITCTPYGINTHRILVHAERVAFDAAPRRANSSTLAVAPSDITDRRTLPLLVACAGLGLPLLMRAVSRVAGCLRGDRRAKRVRMEATPSASHCGREDTDRR